MEGHDRLLTQTEVAALFRVNRKTVRRWRQAGKLTTIRTPGGQLRYRESEVRALLASPDDRPGHPGAPPLAGPVPSPNRHQEDTNG